MVHKLAHLSIYIKLMVLVGNMKSSKLFVLLSGIIVIMSIISAHFLFGRFHHFGPYDVPGSKWVCLEQGIKLFISDDSTNRAIMKRGTDTVYMYFSFDSTHSWIEIFRITEDEYYGELKPIKVEDQLLLGGQFFCSKNKLRIICGQRYDQDTWRVDNKHGLVMIFQRMD